MRPKMSRRWYQFSLKTLLILMTIAALPFGAHVAYKSYLVRRHLAEIEGSYRWLEALDYEPMPNARPIRVVTKSWYGDDVKQDTEEPATSEFTCWLLNEDDQAFEVLTPQLETRSIPREERGDSYRNISTHEPIDLPTMARKAFKQTHDNHGQFVYPAWVQSERKNLFVLSWACARNGYGELAIKLYEAAEASTSWSLNKNESSSFLEKLQTDFAYGETWGATEACGTLTPRPELLQKFRRLQRRFPKSEYAAAVAEKVKILEAMVTEDEQHARQRENGVPFDQLPKNEQITELIFQLRDQNGHQFSQPGSCDVLWTMDAGSLTGKGSSPGHRLVEFGYDAILQLAAALSDQRLTRSVEFHRNFYFSHTVLTVGDAAEQILEHIAGRSFDPAERYEDKTKRLAEVRDQALAWHAALLDKGERACWIEAVERGDRTSLSLAYRLVKKYPQAACAAILRAVSAADDPYCRMSLIQMLDGVPSDESVPFLLAELRHETILFRRTAAEVLTAVGRPNGIEAMIREWESSENIAELKGVGPFLARCGSKETLRAVMQRFAEQPIDQRLETMEVASQLSADKLQAEPELRQVVVELFLMGLMDTEVRSGMSGSRGSMSYSDPRVCDLAGYHLNALDASIYEFDLGSPLTKREVARQAILAKYGIGDP